MEQAVRPLPRFEHALVGFSISATYAAASIHWLYLARFGFFGIAGGASLLVLALTYALVAHRSKLVARCALTIAVVPLFLSPLPQVLLIYPLYLFGRYCLSLEVIPPVGHFRPNGILYDACVFVPTLFCLLVLLVVNPDYLFQLRKLPAFETVDLGVSVILLGLIAMAFLAAARLRGKKFTFPKVAAFIFSILFAAISMLIVVMAPAFVVMSEQMREVPGPSTH